jgi:hypothetical protein
MKRVRVCSTHVSVDIFKRKACAEDTRRRSRSTWQTNIDMGIIIIIIIIITNCNWDVTR